MSDPSSNRRVAKNTLLLYIRMFITMAIGIWTSRIVLNALGFTDQGLYNVVGGFVGLSGLITASISTSMYRFITIAIGSGDEEKAQKAVQNAISVQWILAIIVVLLAETIGLWFLNNKLVVPPDRIIAVNIVYQLSIGGLVVGFVSSAPNALVAAHEKMGVFATVAIINSVALLGIALSVANYGGDRLVLYSSLHFVLVLLIRAIYILYCKRSFPNLKMKFGFDKNIFKDMLGFAGWSSVGISAGILRGSGTSVLLNLFGGPIANTINGIAGSANTLVTIFVNDFTMAYSPQVTKKYAAAEYGELVQFICRCAKFSYSLLLVMAVPVFFSVEELLIIWLTDIPDGTTVFARLIIIDSLIGCICRPLTIAKEATGHIRNYQIITGAIYLITIPLTYLFLKFGLPLYFSYISIIITSILVLVTRILMLNDIPGWSPRGFMKKVVMRCVTATILAALSLGVLYELIPDSAFFTIIQCVIGFFVCCIWVYYIVFEKYERKALKIMCMEYLNRAIPFKFRITND